MKVTVENKKGLNKDLKVFIDKKTISSYMDEKYEEVKNTVTLKGFRPGKVPKEILKKQFGQAIGKFQGVGFQIADMITDIDAADLLTLKSAWMLDQGQPSNREIASAKVFASETLASVTDKTLQIFGGMGLMDDFPIERFWRDARVERIWDGTSEIQRHIISRELLRPLGA